MLLERKGPSGIADSRAESTDCGHGCLGRKKSPVFHSVKSIQGYPFVPLSPDIPKLLLLTLGIHVARQTCFITDASLPNPHSAGALAVNALSLKPSSGFMVPLSIGHNLNQSRST